MEKQSFKIEIAKTNGLWTAELYQSVNIQEVEGWELLHQVHSDNYSNLQFKMAEDGMIDTLNQSE